MNFEDILNIAAQKQKNAEKELTTTKRYSTVAKPAKKLVKPKPKSVQSAAIRALLEKKQEEEKMNALKAKKRMEDAQEVLKKKRKKTDIVKSLASSNTSSKTEKTQDKMADDEKYESQEHKVKHMQFMQKVSKLGSPRDDDVEKKRTNYNRPPDRPVPKKKAPPPPSKPMSFQELMKMAEKKKSEPLPVPKIHEELFGADSDDGEEEEREEARYVYHSKGRDLDTKGSTNQPGKSRSSGSKADKSKPVLEKSKFSRDAPKPGTSKTSFTNKTAASSKSGSSSAYNGASKSVTPTKQMVHPTNRRGETQDKSRSMLESASKPKCTLVVESLPSRTTMGPQRPPHPGRGCQGMRRAMKRPHEDSEEECDDFIDDSNEDVDYSKYIREIFGYDKRKYRYESDREINNMESNFRQVMQEEARSARLAIQEDAEELRKVTEEEKRKQQRAKGKQRK